MRRVTFTPNELASLKATCGKEALSYGNTFDDRNQGQDVD